MQSSSRKKCEIVEIITPKKIVLNGLWFGPIQAKVGFIFIPGLGGNVFSKLDLLAWLASSHFSVLSLNTRGHDKVVKIQKIDKRTIKGYYSINGGSAHEVFTECKDDIAGAVKFLLSRKIKNIYLIGHSTGCQKSVYYLAKGKFKEKVQGAILLCPISDYASAVKEYGKKKLKKVASIARQMVRTGRSHNILPLNLWPGYVDAQRFLSLYTSNSPEEIFSYIDPDKKPYSLLKVKQPLLIILAGQDQYQDRPAKQIANWFDKYINHPRSQVKIFTKANHSLVGYEKLIAKLSHYWIQKGWRNVKNK